MQLQQNERKNTPTSDNSEIFQIHFAFSLVFVFKKQSREIL